MALKNDMIISGNWLFRWRSYLPLIMGLVVVAGLFHFQYFLGRHDLDLVWDLFSILISFSGLVVRILTIGFVPMGTSGRNTHQQEATVLNTTGMYSIVRHPLYLGNFIIWLGISIFLHEWWISCIFVLVFWLYYERIILAEEEFLQEKFGDDFTRWADRTPAFIPKFQNWQKPSLPFSWKYVLKKEYCGFYAIILIFTMLEIFGEYIIVHKFRFELSWIIFFSTGTAIYLLIRFLKKKTNVLSFSR